MKYTTRSLMSRRSALLCGAAGLATMLPGVAFSQGNYPTRPVKFYVPFGAGSSSDITARTYAKVFGDIAGQSVVVENRGGGEGIIGARAVLGEPADGYSILFASNTVLSTNAAIRKNLPYDPLKDFEPISVLEISYAAVAVPASSKFKTFEELVQFAAKNPGKLNHGGGTPTYTLWNEWLAQLLGIKVTNIPYKDSGEAAKAVAAGEVDYAVTAVNPLLPLADGGRVRILMFTGDKRHPKLPGVPTVKEVGPKGYEALIYNAVAVRAGTPRPIRDRIVEIIRQASTMDVVKERIAAQGHTSFFSGPDEMRKFQVAEIERWRKLVSETGLKFE
ncbi:tripartite tricarboxylate transporter substrate binding protein [Ottowia sp.]|uniref:Bug family tripartite tricarboxylate transporter substrate binding protein n=1 Tax=Ottowia sp. TaxID=1898956 RepID=UPI0026013AD6|nr:tripartite tricarboxylate transporter substrate binding protein [Ottowia sp.]MBK6746990.1 tripartite tricarboxylate transporter substrate binding protein [Ottowia sp.]